jgi:hypothetical protein
MPFERPALIRLTVIFGISTATYALAGMLAMHVGDRLIAHAQELRELQAAIEMPVTTGSAPLSATPAAAR